MNANYKKKASKQNKHKINNITEKQFPKLQIRQVSYPLCMSLLKIYTRNTSTL